jgi:glycosyltransferase involved in cell wall biosynthesis
MIDVSVIIPTFNRVNDLVVALDSVFDQPNINVECIVVDDGSTDGTVAHIRERYKNNNLLIIEKLIRSGAQSSRNLGIAAAQGEFVTFLDSDDYFEPNSLAVRVRRCRDIGLDALFSGYRVRFIGRKWDLVKNIDNRSRRCPSVYSEALQDFKIAPMITIIYRRSAHRDITLDETLTSGHDDDLSLTLIRAGRYAFDNTIAATIIQHIGERVATPRNLLIGDAQLLRKYSADVIHYHGVNYMIKRLASVIAGLWSLGQLKSSAELLSLAPNRIAIAQTFCFSVYKTPFFWWQSLQKHLKVSIVRSLL